MISGAAQADVCLLMVPADGNFTTAIQKGDHKAGEIQGQTRQHARLLNLLGVRQLIVGINKMDADTAGYKQVGAGCGGGWGRGEESRGRDPFPTLHDVWAAHSRLVPPYVRVPVHPPTAEQGACSHPCRCAV